MLRLALFCLLAVAACAARPNVVLVYADDLGFGDLGCYGHPVIRTPHLDALARDGLRFTRFYAPSALCSPSRAGLLTGRTPYRTGIRSWIPGGSSVFLSRQELTLAALLRREGYATALVGKWHLNGDLGDPGQPQPVDHGFDHAYGHNAFQVPTNRNPTNVYRNGKLLRAQEGFTAQLYADEAIAWLEQRAASAQPFFLYLAPAEPHSTIENPSEYNAMYAAYTRGPVVPIPSGLPAVPEKLLVPRGPGEYYANVSYLDAQLGRVFAALDRLGLRENTIVVFSSDNGPVTSAWDSWHEVNLHGDTGGLRGRKAQLYEGGLRVPAIVRWPGKIAAGQSTDAPVTALDLFPTLLALCGAKVPADRTIDGVDISTVLRGEPAPVRASFYWALPTRRHEFAWRVGDWKLLLDSSQQPLELFDLSRDPLELIDRLRAEPERVAAMLAAFRTHHESVLADALRPATAR
jgi:arylsulfatase A-like enzyme